ncbi:hypothetical protein BT69DRAFT_1354049 [Atractiella rhizophila]|nr:hypothetical protein BT69DRAFT_1354049 [Atractiella rhizophila]
MPPSRLLQHTAVAVFLSIALYFYLTTNTFTPDTEQLYIHESASRVSQVPFRPTSPEHIPKVAIIGAGAAGSSAAFFLSHLSSSVSTLPPVDITVYERRPYVGGRSTVIIPFINNDELPQGFESTIADDVELVELGASIFVEANRNLWKISDVLGLERIEGLGGENGGKTAIWNGREVLLMMGGSWIDKAKALWRYGVSPLRVDSYTAKAVNGFLAVYKSAFTSLGPFPSIPSFLQRPPLSDDSLPFSDLVSNTFYPWFTSKVSSFGLSTYLKEIGGVACGVNYGTGVNVISALGGFVSFAANGAVHIKGGNRLMFSGFLEKANELSGGRVKLELETAVSYAKQLRDERGDVIGWNVSYTDYATGRLRGYDIYDAIVLASPMQLLEPMITFDFGSPSSPSSPSEKPSSVRTYDGAHKGIDLVPKMNFVHLHVTMVVTNATRPDKKYFGFKDNEEGPGGVYGTFDALDGEDAREILDFHSLNYLKRLNTTGTEDLFIVKFFSLRALSKEKLGEVFGGVENLIWVLRKEWNVYAELTPVTNSKDFADFRLAERLY